MNNIYNKLKTKRHYKRKPKCKNKLGLCEFDHCRCDMSLKIKPRPVQAMLSKEEWQIFEAVTENITQGEYSKKLQKQRKWWNIVELLIIVSVIIVVLLALTHKI